MPYRRPIQAMVALLLVAFILTALPRVASAQTQDAVPVERLTTVTAEIWPDFDEPSVLVLLTATLPQGSTFPARLTLPVPDSARLNAVARVSMVNEQGDVNMFEDIQYQRLEDQLIMTLEEPVVRVEYYYPYEESGNTHQFSYEAPSGLVIDNLIVSVQQPALAASLTTEPAPTDESTDSIGLNYDNFVRSISAGDAPLIIVVTYEMSESTLTVDTLEPVDTGAPPVPTVPASGSEAAGTPNEDGPNWLLLVLGGVGLLISGLFLGSGIRDWQQSRQRKGRTPSKPRPRRGRKRRLPAEERESALPVVEEEKGAGFCHKCGAPVSGGGDLFCRQCGTRLKGR